MDQRIREVEELSQGMTLQQLRSLTDEDVVRRHDVLMDPETAFGRLGPEDYRAELDRRATAAHTRQIEIYADRLDRFTRELIGLTIVIVLQTTVVVTLEVEAHHRGWGALPALWRWA